MEDKFELLCQRQQKILKEAKKSLESEKLSLWSYKADLNTISIKLKKLKQQIEKQEDTYYQLHEEIKISNHELEFIIELINYSICTGIIELTNPWKIIQDICGGICKILGFSDCSWYNFRVIYN